MKQKILSLITLVVLGTGVITAQTNDKKDKATVCPEMKCEKPLCTGDSAQFRHPRHGQRPHFGQGTPDGKKIGKAQRKKADKKFGKKQMRKRHGRGMRPNMPQVKSTPKCKCATCVELRKQEELQAKIDSMRKETFKMQHELDSLRGITPHKGNMPPADKLPVSKKK